MFTGGDSLTYHLSQVKIEDRNSETKMKNIFIWGFWHLPILVGMIFYHFTCFDLFVSSRTHPSAPATCLMPWWTRSTWTGAWCWPSCCTASPRRWARRWPRCLNVRYLTPDNSCMCAGPWVMFNKHHHQHWTRWNRADAAPERFIRRSYRDSFMQLFWGKWFIL